jgi:UDP-N-acetylglucosamine--N-acetylmuramyl-(pentapeptide) pyrophosphoryl-undecaprenol N-acetylglucosamine transferase
MEYIKNKILLTGGGTGGSVSPLLAIVNSLTPACPAGRPALSPAILRGGAGEGDYNFLFIGTKFGPERKMVEDANIKFKAIASGKFRRYFSFKNILDLFLILIGFFQAFFIILKFKPDLIISAGSFVSVPVIWAGWILRAPILIHQQDVRAGLANKLMAPFARVVTVTFEESLKDYGKKAVWTGNPAREFSIFNFQFSINEIRKKFGFGNNISTILIIGGGTGAQAINDLVWAGLDELTKFCNIIHITGKNKNSNYNPEASGPITNYKNYEFLSAEQMAQAYAAADIVVSRAGMGVLTELANLGKPTILIPMPDSHQEDNAEIFRKKEAAVILKQKNLTSEKLAVNIKKLLEDEKLQNKLSNNIKKVVKEGNKEIVKIIKKIVKK